MRQTKIERVELGSDIVRRYFEKNPNAVELGFDKTPIKVALNRAIFSSRYANCIGALILGERDGHGRVAIMVHMNMRLERRSEYFIYFDDNYRTALEKIGRNFTNHEALLFGGRIFNRASHEKKFLKLS